MKNSAPRKPRSKPEREPFRTWRPRYKGKDGKSRAVSTWWLELRNHLRVPCRFSGLPDRLATKALARQIVRLVACRVAGEQPGPDLTKWLEQIPPKLSQRLVKTGLLDLSRATGAQPLKQHLEDFGQSMLARGTTEKQVKQVLSRVTGILDGCGFTVWSDVRADRVERYLADRRAGGEGISAQTSNFYLQALASFCRWMIQNRRASDNPVAHLSRLNVKVDRRHDRTSLEVDEVRRLLGTTTAGPERFGMGGPERALLYKLTVETGLRANEIRTLTADAFDFTGNTITVKAAYSKHRQEDVLPLRPETAQELREFVRTKLPGVKVFGGSYQELTPRTSDMIREDLEACGIDYQDGAGRFRDFHALRHSCGSFLAAMGVHPKVIQSIMRHGDINLTMSRYTHVLRGQEAEAVAKLPDFSLPSIGTEQAKATGTDGKPADLVAKRLGVPLGAIARETSHFGALQCADGGLYSGGTEEGKNAENTGKTLFSAEKGERSRRDSNPRNLSVKRFSRPSL